MSSFTHSPSTPSSVLRSWPQIRKLFLRFRPVAGRASWAFALMLLRTTLELSVPFVVEQAIDDLEGIEGLDNERSAKLIMAARAHWFDQQEATG